MTEKRSIKTKTPIATALWWLASIAFCIWSVMALTKGDMSTMMGFLGAAIFAVPPVQAALRKLMDPGMPRWLVALPAIGLCIAASVASGSAGGTGTPGPPAEEESVDVVANVVRFQRAYFEASLPCKSAFQAIADEGESGVPQLHRMYQLATIAQSQCSLSWDAVGKLDVPVGLSRDERGQFQNARYTCGTAYFVAEQTAGKLKAALDDGMRPSKVAAFRQSAAYAVGERASCETKISEASAAAMTAHSPERRPSVPSAS